MGRFTRTGSGSNPRFLSPVHAVFSGGFTVPATFFSGSFTVPRFGPVRNLSRTVPVLSSSGPVWFRVTRSVAIPKPSKANTPIPLPFPFHACEPKNNLVKTTFLFEPSNPISLNINRDGNGYPFSWIWVQKNSTRRIRILLKFTGLDPDLRKNPDPDPRIWRTRFFLNFLYIKYILKYMIKIPQRAQTLIFPPFSLPQPSALSSLPKSSLQ